MSVVAGLNINQSVVRPLRSRFGLLLVSGGKLGILGLTEGTDLGILTGLYVIQNWKIVHKYIDRN